MVENVTYRLKLWHLYYFLVYLYLDYLPTTPLVLIESRPFLLHANDGIFIADADWFESGIVRDVTIHHHNFIVWLLPVIPDLT